MRVAILGPLEVEPGAAVGGARLRTLLVRLALAAGRAVTVEELAASVWPEGLPADPGNALQTLVSRLRRALPEPGALVSVPGGYRLEADTDAAEFDRLTARARGVDDPAGRAALLAGALSLWRGAALGEVASAPFATGYAARLEEARLAAVEDRAEAELAVLAAGSGTWEGGAGPRATRAPGAARAAGASGAREAVRESVRESVREAGELVGELGELAARHPLRERLHALRVRALLAAGRRAEALAAYEEVRRRLAGELGANPGPALREAHLAALRAEPARSPRTNLRAPLTSFVGRESELRLVRARLAAHRLVTLVGPGGAGKTRLATTVAAELLAEHSAVWLAELASVTDPADVPQAVLAALGGSPLIGGPADTLGKLVEVLSPGRVLLVLDNCEHLVEAAARLAEELLGRCPRLRVLATGREPLGVAGEALGPVPPLPPEPAVRLLADRAAAGRPGLVIEPDVAAEICRRLDGLPLAIELAAARLRVLSPRELADRLDDRFQLLNAGSRTALPRHQTLQAVVAWSWDLLEEPERRLAERLAVFAGGFDLAGAEHVAGFDLAPAAHPGGSLGLLAALVDKSLVQAAEHGRYRMLETIREYALRRLAARGESDEILGRHAAHFLDLAERAEPHLRGHDQLAWIARLVAEHDNLLAALHHAVGTGDAGTALRLAAALGVFWTIRGTRAESTGWIKLALDVPGPAPSQARLIATATYLINGALAGGDAVMASAVEELRQAIDPPPPPTGHPVLAMLQPALALFTDDSELGLKVIEQRLSHPDPWARGMLYAVRAAMKENDGDMRGSRADLGEACRELRACGERWGLALALTSQAEAHAVFGDFDAALEAMREAVTLLRELNPDGDLRHQRVWEATILVRKGEVERARAELLAMTTPGSGRAEPGHELSGRNVAFAHCALGDLARLEGDLEAAAREYAAASEHLETSDSTAPQFRALVLIGQAHLATALGDPGAAGERIRRAARLAMSARDMPVLAHVAVALAGLRAAVGRPGQAAAVLGAAEQLRGAPDASNLDVARLAALLRDRLGGEAYERAYEQGRRLDRAAALALVLTGPPQG
ncbi:AfsR/SARP family transcriptional regulator [Nonomuraea pusilla]|uniref:Predicted ATPase n=1 Tax=Nonomuraea pusilla TaxID=46177 RepID=A0A1H7ITU9_9ACTN|nr:BTAD domain-containing putative transcriptional regulator [Nonomuraea pusilla]SEK65362.1 Predicted ATPase [Nonomuraea pusilla]